MLGYACMHAGGQELPNSAAAAASSAPKQEGGRNYSYYRSGP